MLRINRSREGHWNFPPGGAFFARVEVNTEMGSVKGTAFVIDMGRGKAVTPALEG